MNKKKKIQSKPSSESKMNGRKKALFGSFITLAWYLAECISTPIPYSTFTRSPLQWLLECFVHRFSVFINIPLMLGVSFSLTSFFLLLYLSSTFYFHIAHVTFTVCTPYTRAVCPSFKANHQQQQQSHLLTVIFL